jgi:hypothetical protein
MTTYAVINKALAALQDPPKAPDAPDNEARVYLYSDDAPVEWQGMEFATHDHVALPDDPPPDAPPVPAFVWTRLEYLRRFTPAERITIRAAAAASPILADYLQLLDLAEEVRSDDPDTIAAVQMLEGAGLIAPGRAAEILGGA